MRSSDTYMCVSKLGHLWFRQWASYQIPKIAGCACAGNAGNVFPRRRFQRKPLVSDPGMHHGTCVTHVPWCMSGSLTCGDGENVPGIPGACAPANLRIWQEAHGMSPDWHQVINWSNTALLLIGPLRTNFIEILIQQFSFKKMCLKILSAKFHSFWLGLNVLSSEDFKSVAFTTSEGLCLNNRPMKSPNPTTNPRLMSHRSQKNCRLYNVNFDLSALEF